ncbi:MAG: nucleotidyltransferase family protein [Deltaproteobacteria bacterium]|nr:nucleotidyltransferase family protein [Deltaproteobacteria bacterium]
MSRGLGALVLAAGSSQRMGARNKLTEEIDGRALVARVVGAFEAAGIETIVVVTGHEATRIETALASHRPRIVHNPSHAEGMGSSIARGITALGDCAAAFIALGDLPRLEAATITAIGQSFAEADASADSIHVPTHAGQRGHPVLFGATHFAALAALTGDRGARAIVQRNAARVVEVEVANDGILIDVDTEADLRSAREH